jgi:hypothetical protein
MVDKFARAAEVQFLLDVGAMGFNRFNAQMQFLSDGPGAMTLADQIENLQFAITQALDR